MASRVTQIAVEPAVNVSSNVRLTQEAVEPVVNVDSNVRLTQQAVEPVVNVDSNVRVTQQAVEACIAEDPTFAIQAGTDRYRLPEESTTPDPVDTLTGAYLYRHTDLAIAGRGPSPLFRRSYSSIDARAVASLGPGWTHNYAINLSYPGDGTQDLVL